MSTTRTRNYPLHQTQLKIMVMALPLVSVWYGSQVTVCIRFLQQGDLVSHTFTTYFCRTPQPLVGVTYTYHRRIIPRQCLHTAYVYSPAHHKHIKLYTLMNWRWIWQPGFQEVVLFHIAIVLIFFHPCFAASTLQCWGTPHLLRLIACAFSRSSTV